MPVNEQLLPKQSQSERNSGALHRMETREKKNSSFSHCCILFDAIDTEWNSVDGSVRPSLMWLIILSREA